MIRFLSLALSFFFLVSEDAQAATTLTEPLHTEFARGNSMTFPPGSVVTHHANGQVAAVSIVKAMDPTYVEWYRPNGERLLLDCGARRPTRKIPRAQVRVVGFHKNGEYAFGCTTADYAEFKTSNSYVRVGPLSEINLNKKVGLEYASLATEGYALVENQKLPLLERSEINFHASGELDFFTPAPGTSFVTKTVYGKLFFQQNFIRPHHVRFMKNGHIQKAVLQQPFTAAGLELLPGSGVVFAENLENGSVYLQAARLPDLTTFVTKGGYELISNIFKFAPSLNVEAIVLDRGFTFTNPENLKEIAIPAGSRIFVDQERTIRAIRVPGQDR